MSLALDGWGRVFLSYPTISSSCGTLELVLLSLLLVPLTLRGGGGGGGTADTVKEPRLALLVDDILAMGGAGASFVRVIDSSWGWRLKRPRSSPSSSGCRGKFNDLRPGLGRFDASKLRPPGGIETRAKLFLEVVVLDLLI